MFPTFKIQEILRLQPIYHEMPHEDDVATFQLLSFSTFGIKHFLKGSTIQCTEILRFPEFQVNNRFLYLMNYISPISLIEEGGRRMELGCFRLTKVTLQQSHI